MLKIIKYLNAVIDGRDPLKLNEYIDEKQQGLKQEQIELTGNPDAEVPDDEVFGVFNYLTIRQSGNLCVLHYNARMRSQGWDDYEGALRDCRGLVIDLTDMSVVLRPYSKFFNIDQVAETQQNLIDERIANAKSIEFAEKMDGTLICAGIYKDELIVATSGMIDKNTSSYIKSTLKFLAKHPEYEHMIRSCPGYTWMFERLAPDDPHIVDYPSLGVPFGLYLHGRRNIETGECDKYSDIAKLGDIYGIPHVKVLYGASMKDIQSLNRNSSAKESEGYVANIDGFFLKLKGDDYLRYSARINHMNFNAVLKSIADGTLDSDIDDFIGTPYMEYIMESKAEIDGYVNLMDTVVNDICNERAGCSPKEFFGSLKGIPKMLVGYAGERYLGREFNYLKKGPKDNEHYTSTEEMRQYSEAAMRYAQEHGLDISVTPHEHIEDEECL